MAIGLDWSDLRTIRNMRLSSLADYAVVMMSAAARHCGGIGAAERDAARRGDRRAAADRAEAGQPAVRRRADRERARHRRRLSPVAPAGAISLADIVEAVEGPIALTTCVDAGSARLRARGQLPGEAALGVVNGAVRGALAGVSLASLAQPCSRGGDARIMATKNAEAYAAVDQDVRMGLSVRTSSRTSRPRG